MPKCGKQLKINAILLLVGISTFIPRIFSSDEHNFPDQRYDFVDVAKETAGRRNKGQTTRIFTTDDELDEKFWLKYLGVDFRNAVQLNVDSENNFIPLTDGPTPLRKPNVDKRTRYVREPTQEVNDKQLPVEKLHEYEGDENQTFIATATTSATTTTPSPDTKTINIVQPHFNIKKSAKHKDKLLARDKIIQKKYGKMKPCRIHKPLNEPIVANSPPQTLSPADNINETHLPVLAQASPAVYHQNVELYPRNTPPNGKYLMHANPLYSDHVPSLYLNNQNLAFYAQPWLQDAQHFYPPHIAEYDMPSSTHQTHSSPLHRTTTTSSSSSHTTHNM